jgi:hypothetical protein
MFNSVAHVSTDGPNSSLVKATGAHPQAVTVGITHSPDMARDAALNIYNEVLCDATFRDCDPIRKGVYP